MLIQMMKPLFDYAAQNYEKPDKLYYEGLKKLTEPYEKELQKALNPMRYSA